MTTTASWRPSRWTLRTKLVAWMLLLFLVVTLAVGALSVWQLSRTLRSQMDAQLYQSARRFNGQYSDTIGGPPPVAGESIRVTLLTSSGQLAPLAVRYKDGTTGVETDNYVYGFKTPRALSDKQVSILQKAGIGDAPQTVELGSYLGRYRVIAVNSEAGVGIGPSLRNASVTTIIGLPMGPNQSTVVKTAVAIGLLSGSGVILVALAATYIVRRNLEPLRRVAATATRVSKLPLSSGEVVMPERVEPRDTDEGTEVGQVGASLNDMLDHVYNALSARQASEMQVRQFVADASHELRTPLASIRGYAELSRRETQPVPQGVTHALGRIESEADRMTTLVEDLLLLARLDSGRPLNVEPVELPIVAIETISDARAAGPDHVWGLDLPEEGVEIEGDEARIRQILINLLGNARKHTPPGTHVVMSVHPQDDGVLLQVRDDGPGIAPELVPRIFERFIRGDAARTRTEGSTGLGLSIVSAVVAAHHGKVDVTSRPGETVFSIWLPRRQSARGPAAPSPAAPRDPRVPV
ncbi:MAG TPA: HAMP domain-containing sensor histidine kinase [Flexivirga sp.]|uniref:HAMP domain-containing sensor histidine kinase n=1 Tax=Flexivirga sp. TaxID=1962927 RepID=UPI002C530B6E|nr:HAMP domain-containing sensor histidine kinase [Flexivirga sp.]HWC24492.1 HAMP domain-containing sensor histidine kinase [Flexivirga sp.]